MFLENQIKEISKDKWIIEGNYNSSLSERMKRADLLIWLDYNRFAAFKGVVTRVLKGYGKVRPEMPAGCPERFDWEFMKYIWHFPKTQNIKNEEVVAPYRGNLDILQFQNRRELNTYLQNV